MGRQSLAGPWKFFPDPEEQGEAKGFQSPEFDDIAWKQMEIPGHWHLAGLDFHGKVWFRKKFKSEFAEGARLFFQGVDYAARVWLNGKLLGIHTGYFDPFSFEVSHHLKAGQENLIAVEVDGSLDPGFPFRKKFFKGGLSHWDMRPGGWTERGQDRPSAGIWGPVFLESSGIAYIEEFLPRVIRDQGRWAVQINLRIINRKGKPLECDLEFSLAPKNFPGEKDYRFSEKLTLSPGSNELSYSYEVDSPELWWTWDLGNPHLYTCSTRVLVDGRVSDEAERGIGFRTIDWKKAGVYLNDKRVFLRGSCYLSSLWLGEMTRERSLADLDLVKGASMNSLRICYHVEPFHFYDLCDQAGILLWQDFAMLWDYDTSEESRAEAERQIRKMVRLLGHHPSIYMWVCHCEPMSPSNRRMDRELAKAVAEEEKTGRRIKPSTEMKEHPFFGWYFSTKLGFAGLPGRPIPNEYGTQSLPRSRARLWKELGDAAWPPNPAWEYHNCQRELFFSMRDCASLNEMIERSQEYQGEVLDFGIQAFRRAKGRIWGSYIFTFVDAWPSITWSIVDYERNTKASYHIVKKAYKPVKLSLDILKTDSTPSPWLGWLAWNHHFDLGAEFKAKLWIINDLAEDIPEAQLRWEIIGPEGVLSYGEKQINIRADSSEIATEISHPLSGSLPAGAYKLNALLYDYEKEIDREEMDLFFGPPGTRRRNALRQMGAAAKADFYHAFYALKTFPVQVVNSLIGRYKRYNRRTT
jgi:beta-mannosidase